MDIKVLNNISYGMYVIATKYNDRNVGCFVNTVNQITSQNPIISVSVNKNNYTNEALREQKKFSVSILSEKTDSSIIGKFGFFSARDTDKFLGIDYYEINGVPVLNENTCGNIICEVINVIDAETHDIFLARVIDTIISTNDFVPMTYKYYHEVIKGKAPKTAPTYIAEQPQINKIEEENTNDKTLEDESEKLDKYKNVEACESKTEYKKYRCTICGHIYDESVEKVKFEELPETWVCPICRVGKALFEEVK